MIVITGATGALNGTTVEHLLRRVPARRIAVAVRDVGRAAHLAALGVTVRHGDYADEGSLATAFAGAERLLLVSSNDPAGDPVALHGAAIRAAAAAGAGRVLYTSHQGAAAGSPFAPARVHAATEELLAGSGLAWTSLRNGFYAHSLGWLLGDWRTSGRIVVPADGPVSWTARDDEAEAAAVLLASEEIPDGPLTLTAAAAPTFADVAETASRLVGDPVGLDVVAPDDWVRRQVAAGAPDARARFSLGIFEAARHGFFAGVDPLLGRLLSRQPRTVADVLAPQAGVTPA